MNAREIALGAAALDLAKRLNDCCPDVGMGPSIGMLADDVLSPLGYSEQEQQTIIRHYATTSNSQD